VALEASPGGCVRIASTASELRPAVFLDRDGTIIEDVGYLHDPARMKVFPWAAAAIRRLNGAGFAVVVITNQSGVARGLFDEDAIGVIHRTLSKTLAAGEATIDAYYFCPHHPQGLIEPYGIACGCRKPLPGLVQRAAADLGLDLSRSWMVGDRWLDIECGVAAGCRSILVGTSEAVTDATAETATRGADAILNNLMEAAEWILLNSSR
jgi:D-glycero-D-manno-heptose 1,7-bisphosphate phosphatase